MLLEFEINKKPIPQARPRFYVRHHGLKHFVGAYDPAKCKTYKEFVAWHAKIIAIKKGLREPVKGPIAISLTFRMGENGKERFHTKRPDLDNLAKAIKDALKGVIYADDSQIVEAHLFKRYGEPQVKVQIKSLEVKRVD